MDTLIGSQNEISGDINFSGGLYIEGIVKGNVTAKNDNKSLIHLSETGVIKGEVRAPFVTLNGTVDGDVHGGVQVQLAPKARISGNVYYNLIEMSIGAELNGRLVHVQRSDDAPLALGHTNPLDETECLGEPDVDLE